MISHLMLSLVWLGMPLQSPANDSPEAAFGRVSGVVVEAGTDAYSPLAYALVQLTTGAQRLETRSGSGGQFVLDEVPVGTYRLAVVKPGKASMT